MAIRCRVVLAVLCLLTCTPLAAYDEPTHQLLTKVSVMRSVLATDPTLLQSIGVAPYTAGSYPVFHGNVAVGSRTALDAAAWGAFEEDNYNGLSSVLTHFMDPQNGGRGLTVASPPLSPRTSSLAWATAGVGQFPDQAYSFANGQQYLLAALTGTTPSVRSNSLGRMFQTLGHLTHHIQDMGQPQHVKNEAHVHYGVVSQAAAFFEKYTSRNLNPVLEQRLATWPVVPIPAFPSVSQYWTGGTSPYVGMADVSSRNFITYNTSFTMNADGTVSPVPAYPLPNGINPDGSRVSIVPQVVTLRSLNTGADMQGVVNYIVGTVRDDFAGNKPSVRLAAESQLEQLTSASLGTPRRFGVEDGNVLDDYYRVMMPRIVAFGAGVINHFFRGRTTLSFVSNRTWKITNTSSATLSGTFSVLAEDSAQNRTSTPFGVVTTLAPGGAVNLDLTFSTVPAKLVLAFQGSVGGESGMAAGNVVDYIPPPIPCGAPISAAGGSTGFTKTMDLGTVAGTVQVQFEAYAIPDSLVITRGGQTVATTNGLVSGLRSFSFSQTSVSPRTIDIKVTGNSDINTQWTLAVSCPGGALTPPRPTVQVFFGTDPSQSCGVSCSTLQICGVYSVRINGQTNSASGFTVPLTAGTNVLMEVSHNDPLCGSGLATPTKAPGLFYYRDNAGKHYFNSLGSNWVTVQ